ncbi:MAG: exonuclease subunit SbcD, partial [Bacteroidaceae bacterium]|nr:exonuclease subunit SbcD [Bacteroidaceae bacterium]
MKIIHTADWHLGQTFYGYERAYEHRIFLSWLAKQISDREIDALLISGDVFDNPNPSAEAQSMFYDFIKRLTTENPQLRIVITAGNHDSAARLEAPAPILEGFNVTIRG